MEEKKYIKRISDEKINQAINLVNGLDNSQWNSIKSSIDLVYETKAIKVKFDSLTDYQIVKSYLEL